MGKRTKYAETIMNEIAKSFNETFALKKVCFMIAEQANTILQGQFGLDWIKLGYIVHAT